MKRVLVGGAGGFIGSHLVRRLKKEGFWVRGVDLKRPEFSESRADEFVVGDLRDVGLVLLCHKRLQQQNGQQASCLSRSLASRMRSVVIEYGLCRSARTRCAAGEEVGRNARGA